MSGKEVAILYHAGCPDGFGSAYAAWKKFGDTIDYIPAKHGRPVPEGLEGKRLYFVDFCYPQEIMDDLVKKSASITVLDHHEGSRSVIESMPEHVYDEKHSGAIIAWNYFYPGTPAPTLLRYIEDGDFYFFKLPDSRAILSYVYAQPHNFEVWDDTAMKLEDDSSRAAITQKGRTYDEHFALIVDQIVRRAILVSFEGIECYIASAPGIFASDVCHALYKLKPPLGMSVTLNGDLLQVSMRSDPTFDASVLARKHGGNGHPQSCAFMVKWGDPLPWTILKEHENPRG